MTRSDSTAEGGAPAPTPTPTPTLTVEGAQLLDRCRRPLLLRGVSEMIVWSDGQDGDPELSEIKKTGANAVRIIWELDGEAAALERTLARAIQLKLIPVLALQDGIGDFSQLPALVDYWTSAETLGAIAAAAPYLVVEVGNGVGGVVPVDEWRVGWAEALRRLRSAGLSAPILIDAPLEGADYARLLEAGAEILDEDPLQRSLLGLGIWWEASQDKGVEAVLSQLFAARLPLVITAFSSTNVAECAAGTTDYQEVMRLSEQYSFSYFAWSWGGVKNQSCAAFDMSSDGTYAGLLSWGQEVVNDPSGISSTSRAAAFGESCEP